MLDHILASVRTFESLHGIKPNVVCINPYHYAELCRQYHGLFEPDQGVIPGFHLVILPRSRLPHPRAAMLPGLRTHSPAA